MPPTKGPLASPPLTPPLPALSDEQLRRGGKLDFVSAFGLEDDFAASLKEQEVLKGRDELNDGNGNAGSGKGDGVISEAGLRTPDVTNGALHKTSDEALASNLPNDIPGRTATQEEHGYTNGHAEERALPKSNGPDGEATRHRPLHSKRHLSTPLMTTADSFKASSKSIKIPSTLRTDELRTPRTPSKGTVPSTPEPSPMPRSIPVPPLSLPMLLQLEMSSDRPSSLYIHRSSTSDFPYESCRVKIDRLKNFMSLPPQLEQVLWFGAFACMDSWLYLFTILPLRFLKALAILGNALALNMVKEVQFVGRFVYSGSLRLWERRRRKTSSAELAPRDVGANDDSRDRAAKHARERRKASTTPSALTPDQKADILKGFLILLSCMMMMYFDASRMYHGIRGQAAIKLYVIYNVLEVCDRLFSALGQDILECLFSKETLERKADGRSKVLRPFWLFMLALAYNLVHATALFYQVITLNVAVNSYSNALLTLLMSNQFVEIKSTVFKRFEKENLFQLTCADVVERFQLWLMLIIIAARNMIETGGLSLSPADGSSSADAGLGSSMSILPSSFTWFPSWSGQVLTPFFIVLGSEMLVDWLKHAYITKFNNTKPAIYGRFLDVLCKDYYSNAFADQNLTRRLGLPVIPLACLFIRASVQTYHMFLATHTTAPPVASTATSLSVDSASSSPATMAALAHIDALLQRALYSDTPISFTAYPSQAVDLLLPYLLPLTTLLFIFILFLFFKLVLGMALLSFARMRYRSMKEREGVSTHAEGRRVGGWGVVEVDADKRRWIYADDHEGAKKLREREARDRERAKARMDGFEGVERYSMVAKRIW